MSMKRRIAGGAAVVAGGHAVGLVASLLRNVIIARAIGVENFGIAATFLVTISLVEMLADLSIDKLLVQAEDGDEPRLQAVAHALNAVRGVIVGVVLFALAVPIAGLFDAPQAAWAYALLALAPVVRSLAHLDVRRMQRTLVFLPGTILDAGSQLLAVIIAAVLVLWIDDYAVALWVILGQSLGFTIASHALATRRYQWSFDRPTWKRFAAFGWPLMLNGGLIWAATQGDRLLIGAIISTAALGLYTAATSILNVPSTAVMTIGGRLGLPLLSKLQSQPEAYTRQTRLISGVYALFIAGSFVPLGVFLPLIVTVAFGADYAIDSAAASLLALAMAVRTCRALPTLIALSLARTRTILIGNVARAALLPLLIVAAYTGRSLVHVAAALAVIEALSLAVTWFCVCRGSHVMLQWREVIALGWMPVVASAAVVGAGLLIPVDAPAVGLLVCAGVIAATVGGVLGLSSQMRLAGATFLRRWIPTSRSRSPMPEPPGASFERSEQGWSQP